MKKTPMKKLLTTIGLIILAVILIIIGWFVYKSFQSEQSPAPQSQEQTLQEEAAQKAVESVPELNPIEKTNPFAGSYKNPFKK
jgi:predicted negative regulator of RcsB-dependent stress response